MKMPINRLSSTLALVAPAFALIASNADAAAYIKFDGVDGEATNSDHKDWIIIESFGWSVSEAAPARVAVKEFSIKHRIDKSSPLLFLACATGEPIPTVTLVMTRTVNGAEEEYYRITLKNVIISSIGADLTADVSVRPLETVKLNFPKVEIAYTPYDDANGTMGTPITSGEIVTESPTAP